MHAGEPSGDLAPVFVFVHGGGFVAGDKHHPGSPACDLVGAGAARHGTMPDLVWVDGHDHMSAVPSLGVDEAALGVPWPASRNGTRLYGWAKWA
ncbi:MAG TPA: hypothetical protein VF838_05080 [Trebonia sp.]